MVQTNYKPKVLDLFCGCGGLSLGFIQAGYEVVLGVDIDAAALRTYEKNHTESEVLLGDLSDEKTFARMLDKVNGQKIDVVIGGPPCQGFSLTGPRNLNDERNKLYRAVLRSVEELNPKAFIIENVPGMASLYDGKIREEIIQYFEDIGYTVNSDILLAADYGVPQMRKRLFFVGLRKDLDLGKFDFPKVTHYLDTYVTCEQAIGDLPSRESEFGEEEDRYGMPPQSDYQKLMRGQCESLYNHVATRHTEMVKNVIALVPEGGNYKDLPPGVGESRKFNEAWTRYHSQKPSRTIDTGHRNHFHYKYNRVPTIRENARLQSFPDDFIFYGTKTQQNRQVGNAVPPMLSNKVASKLKEYLNQSMMTHV